MTDTKLTQNSLQQKPDNNFSDLIQTIKNPYFLTD